jgi:hypothetical protein
MKTLLLALALIFSLALRTQTESKTTTVRIKKVENINGVEKVTDTTYTTSEPVMFDKEGGNIDVKDMVDGDGKVKRTVIIEKNANGSNLSEVELRKVDEPIIIIKDGEKGPQDLTNRTVIIKRPGCGATKEEIDRAPVIYRAIITGTMSETELKKLRKTAAVDNKLEVQKFNLYPNPSAGKFNLSFTLPAGAQAKISILNMDGVSVYEENLPDFNGSYNKEIDLSGQTKGTYFIRVQQGDHSTAKKMVLGL